MSVQVMSWVFSHAPKDLRPAEMLVAIALANHASSDGGHAYPSVQTLMDETRLTRRSVQTSLRSLEDRELIAVEREATRRLPAMYGFVAFRGANIAPQEEQEAQLVQSGAQSTHVRGAGFAPKPSEEPSENRQSSPLSPPKGKRATAMTEEWFPDPDLWHWTSEQGFKAAEVDREVPKFVDHHLKVGKPMKDWRAAFRLWMRRSREYAPRMNGSSNGVTKPEDRRPAIPTFEQVMQPPKQLSDEKRAELRAVFAERRESRGTA